MVELIAIIKLCRINSRNAKANNRKGWAYSLLTIFLWVSMEFVGAVIGTMIWGQHWLTYVTALGFAALGGIVVFSLAGRKNHANVVCEEVNAITEPNILLNEPNEKININAIRHPREMRIYKIAVFFNIVAIIIMILLVIGEIKSFYEQLSAIAAEQNMALDAIGMAEISKLFNEIWYDPKIQPRLQLYISVVFLFLFTVAVLEYYFAHLKARAVKVTPKQFGNLYTLAEQYAQSLGLKKVPEIYLVQENGALNAFASNVIRKKFITINIDLLEIGYRQFNDMSSIGFILAHEMAHIRLNHVSIWNRYTVLLSQVIPVVGTMLSRVREYSCDRLAQAASGNDGVDALMALTMGKHLYKKTEVSDYLESSTNAKGFWIWTVNLLSSHPILPKRIRALVNPSVPGKVF